MARHLKTILFLTAIAVVVLPQYTAAQTVYTVGDAMGWSIPTTASDYANWAKNKSFTVGDILVFNFGTGIHDVTEVTKSNFDGCNGASPISKTTKGPANITVKTAGEHYYICSFTGHCSYGQKLEINVTAASTLSPAPQPSASSPPAPAPKKAKSSSPAPAPKSNSSSPAPGPELAPTPGPASAPAGPRSAMTYTVGDTLGWNVPSNASDVVYQNWASGKTFMVGDTLVFNYVNGTHNVAEITKKSYDSCNTSKPISLNTNPPTRIIINTTGVHYFTCTFPKHCSLGQKLAINVTGTAAALPPSPTGMAPAPTTTPPSTTPAGSVAPSSPSDTASPPPNSATMNKRTSGAILSFVVALLLLTC